MTGIEGQIDSIGVHLDIKHLWQSQLKVTLTSPAGTTLVPLDHGGDSADDIIGTFPDTLTPVDSLGALKDEDPNGEWTVTFIDDVAGFSGEMRSWGLRIYGEDIDF